MSGRGKQTLSSIASHKRDTKWSPHTPKEGAAPPSAPSTVLTTLMALVKVC